MWTDNLTEEEKKEIYLTLTHDSEKKAIDRIKLLISLAKNQNNTVEIDEINKRLESIIASVTDKRLQITMEEFSELAKLELSLNNILGENSLTEDKASTKNK